METALHPALLALAVGALVTSWTTYWMGWTYFRGAAQTLMQVQRIILGYVE